MSTAEHMPGPSDGEDTSLLTVLAHTLSSLEYWFKKANPDWDGTAEPGSTIGEARTALTKWLMTGKREPRPASLDARARSLAASAP